MRLQTGMIAQQNEQIRLRHELCSYPPALFDSLLFLRDPQKPVLVNSIWEKVTQSLPVICMQRYKVCGRWWISPSLLASGKEAEDLFAL